MEQFVQLWRNFSILEGMEIFVKSVDISYGPQNLCMLDNRNVYKRSILCRRTFSPLGKSWSKRVTGNDDVRFSNRYVQWTCFCQTKNSSFLSTLKVHEISEHTHPNFLLFVFKLLSMSERQLTWRKSGRQTRFTYYIT